MAGDGETAQSAALIHSADDLSGWRQEGSAPRFTAMSSFTQATIDKAAKIRSPALRMAYLLLKAWLAPQPLCVCNTRHRRGRANPS